MAVNWTEEQKKIIGLRNGNILVAAAAGSGKTAVLVERIVSMITDPEDPVSVDQLLIVTFTNAAAAQMREKIGRRLGELLSQDPDNDELRKQEDLLPHAKIMTIDSFCLYVVRNYFSFLDLDPDFRIGDEAELTLLSEEVLGALLERKYQEADPAFLSFADRYSGKRSDEELKEHIEKLYRFADAYPVPEEQLLIWEQELSGEGMQEWQKSMVRRVRRTAEDVLEQLKYGEELCSQEGYPDYLEAVFRADQALVELLLSGDDYKELYPAFETILNAGFMRMPTRRKDTSDPDKKQFLSDLRKSLRETVQGLIKRYWAGTPEELEAERALTEEPMKQLIGLVREYSEAFAAAKKEKKVVSFGDVEHFALQILTEPSENGRVPSQVAGLLRDHFREIMIDEYQDSNRIQEEILTSLSREILGCPNVFMVGDVKQSIYRFRQARPELFMEKYASYDDMDERYEKIDLHHNFRSADRVLDLVNHVFRQIMIPDVGGVTYDDAAALVHGRQIPEHPAEDKSADTEILFLSSGKSRDERGEEALSDLQGKELEARLIVAKIRELTDPETGFQIYDNELQGYRLCEYRDIVILLRSVSGFSEIFVDELLAADIPAYAQTRTGYFSALEIQVILNLLRIIDNPMQDIPLASVLHSPIGDFSSEEMARLSADFKHNVKQKKFRGLYGALRQGEEDCEDPELREKCRGFLALLKELRESAVYLPLHKLIRLCLEKTGYEYIIGAMPGGRIRLANVEMLMKRASDYEATGYRSLFRFIRYIESIRKFQIDFGEAAAAGEQDNAVRINTIHKSKGLEYPVVILAGCGKKFNKMDTRGRILLHSDLGIAPDLVDADTRVWAPTLAKKVLADEADLDSMGEELRILYVALTRAREKLILTGTHPYLEKKWVRWSSLSLLEKEALPFTTVSAADSYMDWIIMAMARNRAYRKILEDRGMLPQVFHPLYDKYVPASIREADIGDLVFAETGEQLKKELGRRELEALGKESPSRELLEQLEAVYPHEPAVNASRKYSVSRLKKEAMAKTEAEEGFGSSGTISDEAEENAEDKRERKLPAFLSEEQAVSGAQRGTAYHHLMELLSFSGETGEEYVRQEMGRLMEENLFSRQEAELLHTGRIAEFLRSELGQRMARAQEKGRLFREKQFVMSLSGGELPEVPEDEQVLIQGIVDAWFEEEDSIILMDYKTDRVDPEKGEEELVRRYRTQLELYKKALEAAFRKPVSEIWIYSFGLGKAIRV